MLPVFPLRTIEWPGNTVELKVIDPAHRRMYEELLWSGKRRVVAPLAKLPIASDAPETEERRVHSMAPVLLLQDLKEVSGQTGGVVKYIAKHTVVGRARIQRLLNPSALFETDGTGAKVSYLQAEVEVLEEPKMELLKTSTAKELIDVWEEFRAISESQDEPRLQSEDLIKRSVLTTSTWQLADLWQRLLVAIRTYREKARLHAEVREWIRLRQSQGRLPQQLPPRLDAGQIGLPQHLREELVKSQGPIGVEFGSEFWDQLVTILATDDPETRRELLLQWAHEEVRVSEARKALRGVFS